MATPLGHSLAGYALARRAGGERAPLALALLGVVMANAPDLDFLPGILVGHPALYHQGPTHSLGFGLLASLAVAGAWALAARRAFAPILALGVLAWASHLFLDMLGPDGRPPYGIPLFWPIADVHVKASVALFLGVHHADATGASTPEWLLSLLDLRNLAALALEALALAPFVLRAARPATAAGRAGRLA